MLLRDLRPLPQFKIGSYRIDFVLPLADGRRLAIECDGDAYHGPDQWEADIRRQALLERVGNCVFVRIRGSVFSRDPEKAMAALWHRIEDLGGVAPAVPEPPTPTLEYPAPSTPPAAPQLPAVSTAPAEPVVEAAPEQQEPAEQFPRLEMPPTVHLPLTEDSRWVDVPDGYRSIAWVRPQESEAVLQAYATGADAQIREHGRTTGWARFHPDDSEQARKYGANVLLERASPAGTRFVCWLRQSEAKALLQAVAEQSDIAVGERGRGYTGHVQYYQPHSEQARRFRSPTRLLRIRGARHEPDGRHFDYAKDQD
jgi:very-short-patch-repair endonuclease